MDEQSNPIRVLLVDDEQDFLDSTARALARRGFAPQTAERGLEALKMLAGPDPFDVVLLDMKMPGLDGERVFQEIRRRWPALPVVILTGHGTVQQAFQTSKQGVFDYVAKPCDVESLATVLRRAVKQRRALAQTAPDERSAIRLLLVDDESELLESMAAPLGRRGMQVATAPNATEALQLIERQAFDVVVLDLKMPGMDGMQLLRKIKRCCPVVQVIVLTGHPSVLRAVQALRDGAYDFLTKPADIEQLTWRIREAFDKVLSSREQEQRKRIDEVLDRYPD